MHLTCVVRWSEGDRRGSNPRPPGPHPGALPTELRPPREPPVCHTPHEEWAPELTSPGLGPVAQLDRADGFYPSGCGFDSCRGRRGAAGWRVRRDGAGRTEPADVGGGP